MNKGKIAAIIAALMVTLGALSSCSFEATASETPYVPKTKRFEPGQHCYASYYHFVGNEGYNYFKAQVNIPEGYEIKDMEITTNAYSSAEGVIYWFINTEPVEATEGQNTRDSWSYCLPGKVIKEELKLSNGN